MNMRMIICVEMDRGLCCAEAQRSFLDRIIRIDRIKNYEY